MPTLNFTKFISTSQHGHQQKLQDVGAERGSEGGDDQVRGGR